MENIDEAVSPLAALSRSQ